MIDQPERAILADHRMRIEVVVAADCARPEGAAGAGAGCNPTQSCISDTLNAARNPGIVRALFV